MTLSTGPVAMAGVNMDTTMKKISIIALLAMAAMAAFSCKQEAAIEEATATKVVTAFTDQDVTPDTKTTLSGVTVLWCSTDEVVASDGNNNLYTSTGTTVNESGKKAEFTFRGFPATAGIGILAYPAASVTAIDDKAMVVSASIPTVQTAKADSFAEGANLSVATGDVETPIFRNAGGLLSLKIKNDNIKSVKLVANEPMTGGTAQVSAVAPYGTQVSGGECEVELAGGLRNGVTYYAVVYPGTYTGLTIFINDNDGRTATYTNPNALTVERNANLFIAELTVPDSKWEKVEKGDTWAYTFTSKAITATGDVVLSGTTDQTWTVAGDGDYFGYDGTKGQQLGSGSAPFTTLSLSTNFGKTFGVTDVILNTSGASSIAATLSVSVGGTDFVYDGDPTAPVTSVALTNVATEYRFVAADGGLHTGDIVVSYEQTSSKAIYLKSITVNPDTREQVATPTFTPGAGVVSAGTVVTISTTTSGATIYYTTDGSTPTANSTSGTSVTVSDGMTIKAFAVKDGMRDSEVASATYTVGTSNGDGTFEHPFNIAGAKGYIDSGKTDAVYVAGIVSSIVKQYNAEFGNAQFWISDDGKTDDFEAYNAYFLGNKSWTTANNVIKVGDAVVLYGKLTKYNTTYETSNKNAYLYSLNGSTVDDVPVVTKTDITGVSADGVSNQTTTVTIDGGTGWTASVAADGTVVTAASISGTTITYSVAQNTGSARSGAITLTLTNNADATRVLTETITVSQLGSGSAAHAYVKVTDTKDITDGDYLIVNETAGVAFNGELSSFDSAGNVISVKISSGSIEATDAVNKARFTINSMSGGYSICGTSGKYIGVDGYSNGLKTKNDAVANAISISSGNVLISITFSEGTMTLKYNKSSDQNRFRYYKSGQQNIQLYKYQ